MFVWTKWWSFINEDFDRWIRINDYINTFINEILSGVDIDVERVCSFDIEDILAFLKRKVRKQELSLLEANKIKEVFVNILKLTESKKHK